MSFKTNRIASPYQRGNYFNYNSKMNIKKISYIVKLTFVVLIITGCDNSDRKKVLTILDGDWSIDSLIYRNHDIRGCLELNLLQFYGDSVSGLPRTTNFCDSVREWEFKAIHKVYCKDKKDIKLFFKTKSRFFQDTFKVQFLDDINNKLMKMEIQSKETYILCTKGSLESYSKLKNDIKKIAEIKEIHIPYNR
ncbi:MAG: hypothetical protein V4511_03860 [Bacteroidota bacterium]